MALGCWLVLWVWGALLLPGFPSVETGLCGSRQSSSSVPSPQISAPPTGTGAAAPEQPAGPLAQLLDSDQLLYRRPSLLTRRRRNILLPSGVKLCTQETFDQAAANHLTFFQHRGEWLRLNFPFFSFVSRKGAICSVSALTPEALLICPRSFTVRLTRLK